MIEVPLLDGGLADGDEEEGPLSGAETGQLRHPFVVEGADDDGAEAEGDGLESEVLGRGSRLEVDVPARPRAVFPRGPPSTAAKTTTAAASAMKSWSSEAFAKRGASRPAAERSSECVEDEYR